MVGLVLSAKIIFAEGVGYLFYQKSGTGMFDNMGVSVASAGDVNGDGRGDFIVGANFANPDGLNLAGSAYVYSGIDGSLLYQKNGAAIGDDLGRSVASAGDVDGDGKADFIIGAPFADPDGLSSAGSAFVYSGSDGALLFQKNGLGSGFNLGWSVASAGDVNMDGKSDFIIGVPGADPNGITGAGIAFVYSGADGSVLYQNNGATIYDGLGYSVAPAEDVNGDRKSDFIIGSPGDLSAFVYSGSDGALLFQKIGWSVASAGDVNADGKADFIVGDPYASPDGLYLAGSAFIYSGSDGSLLYQKNGTAANVSLGYSVSSAGDVDGDGMTDFIIGACFADPNGLFNAGSAYLYSGADGSLFYHKNGSAEEDFLGFSVASAGDVSGDGRSDFIIGVRDADPGGLYNAGSVFVFSFCRSARGDMSSDSLFTASDVVLMLNCVFLGIGKCDICFADVSCNGMLTTSDVIVELNAVFLGESLCSGQ